MKTTKRAQIQNYKNSLADRGFHGIVQCRMEKQTQYYVENWRPYRESNPVESFRIASQKAGNICLNKEDKGDLWAFSEMRYCEANRTLSVWNCLEKEFLVLPSSEFLEMPVAGLGQK
jgi:hypothetical protein